jgi:HSP20 family protein
MEFGASATPPGFGFRREIDRIVGDAFTRKPDDRRRSSPAPSMEMRETDRELTLMFELPDGGIASIEIAVHDGVLTVSERTQVAVDARDPTGDHAHAVADRRDSSFQQSVQLPKDADELGILTQIEGGILTVHIPKIRAATHHHHAGITRAAAHPPATSPVAMSK